MTQKIETTIKSLSALSTLVGLFKVHVRGLSLTNAKASDAMRGLQASDLRRKKISSGYFRTLALDALPRYLRLDSIERGVRVALNDASMSFSAIRHFGDWYALTDTAYETLWEPRLSYYQQQWETAKNLLITGYKGDLKVTRPSGGELIIKDVSIPSLEEWRDYVAGEAIEIAKASWPGLWAEKQDRQFIIVDGVRFSRDDMAKFYQHVVAYMTSQIPTESEIRERMVIEEDAADVSLAADWYEKMANRIVGETEQATRTAMQKRIEELVARNLSEMPDPFEEAAKQLQERAAAVSKAALYSLRTQGKLPGPTAANLRSTIAWYNATKLGDMTSDAAVAALESAMQAYGSARGDGKEAAIAVLDKALREVIKVDVAIEAIETQPTNDEQAEDTYEAEVVEAAIEALPKLVAKPSPEPEPVAAPIVVRPARSRRMNRITGE